MENSELSSKLIDSLRMISSAVLTLVAAILVISLYLLQRSIRFIAHPPDLPAAIRGESHQIDVWGLQFGYETLTVIWPAILGVLCYAVSFLLDKRLHILGILRQRDNSIALDLLEALDPFLQVEVTGPVRKWSATIRLLSMLPMFTLIPHFASAIIAFISFLIPGTRYSRCLSWQAPVFFFVLLVLLFTSLWGFLGAREFLRSIRSNFNL